MLFDSAFQQKHQLTTDQMTQSCNEAQAGNNN